MAGRKQPTVAALGALAMLSVLPARLALSARYEVIHDGGQHPSKIGPVVDPLAADAAGHLYGEDGNAVFVLKPPLQAGEQWPVRLLFSFSRQAAPSNSPAGGVTLLRGKLFGTNQAGGAFGCGAAFQLVNGTPTSIADIYEFAGLNVTPNDGCQPQSGLTLGLHGLFYGTTKGGGERRSSGTVFSVSQTAANSKYQVLHRFGSKVKGDGIGPTRGRLAVDRFGRLYGMTHGGIQGIGTVFALQYDGIRWQEQVLHNFQGYSDLDAPVANVVLDTQGDVYGCAGGSGTFPNGGLFELTPPAQPGGAWTETVIYSFGNAAGAPIATNGTYGCGITIDPATNRLFGTTYGGGQFGAGTIFELDPPAQGQSGWSLSIIHSFDGSPNDGYNPVAAPLKVGDTYYGGNSGGAIYSFTP